MRVYQKGTKTVRMFDIKTVEMTTLKLLMFMSINFKKILKFCFLIFCIYCYYYLYNFLYIFQTTPATFSFITFWIFAYFLCGREGRGKLKVKHIYLIHRHIIFMCKCVLNLCKCFCHYVYVIFLYMYMHV